MTEHQFSTPGSVTDVPFFLRGPGAVAVVDRDGLARSVHATPAEATPSGADEAQLAIVRQALHSGAVCSYEFAQGSLVIAVVAAPISADEAVVVLQDITAAAADRDATRERTEAAASELRVLMDVSANMALHVELTPLLHKIIEQLHQVVDYGRASIYLLAADTLYLLAFRSSRSGVEDPPAGYHMPAASLGPLWERVARHETVVVDDVHTNKDVILPLRSQLRSIFRSATANIHSQLIVPLAIKERVIGMMTLSHEERGFYTGHHAELMLAVGTQAAIAIENARLFEQASRVAAVEERQRLARELHDSVSQALYGIALGARTARTLLDRDPAEAVGPMDYVLSLAEAGQAEMRALIFELRPESLEREGLVTALQKQLDAVYARYGIEVDATFCTEPDVELIVKEAFYRIGQEALHNVVKHAKASRIVLRLDQQDGLLNLRIEDDGIGFDVGGAFPGHMGLVSMRERADNVGARMLVSSRAGNGSTISVEFGATPT